MVADKTPNQWLQCKKKKKNKTYKVLESSTTHSQYCCCSPRSIFAPPGTPSLWPTRSQVDADETLRCLQPDLPLARRRLRSPTITAFFIYMYVYVIITIILFYQILECVREDLFQCGTSRQVTRSAPSNQPPKSASGMSQQHRRSERANEPRPALPWWLQSGRLRRRLQPRSSQPEALQEYPVVRF